MKLLFAFAMSAAAAFSSECSASSRSFEFVSNITSIYEVASSGQALAAKSQSTLSGPLVQLGDIAVGGFAFDDSASPSPLDVNGAADGFLVFAPALTSFSFGIESSRLFFEASPVSPGNLILTDNSTSRSGSDGFSVFVEAAGGPTVLRLVAINLFDASGTFLSGYSKLPSALPLQSFDYANLHYAWIRSTDGAELHFNATITSLSEVAAVPEPATASSLLLGGLLLSLIYRRQRGA